MPFKTSSRVYRALLTGACASLISSSVASATEPETIGEATKFDFAWLKGQANHLASQPYEAPSEELPEAIANLSWDDYQELRYDKDHALWGDKDLLFQTQFFHLGLFFKSSVRMYTVEDGEAREIAYSSDLFDYGKTGIDGDELPEDLGFAGFRVNYFTDLTRDIFAFLGASYFRAVGGDWQYGLSARGLALNTGMPEPEEFPNFVAFWLETPAEGSKEMTIYTLLDSPSVAGAYRFVVTPGDTLVMDVDVALYPREEVERWGIAPLTSMFQVGENDRRIGYDWRPEIHDSDGLLMWTGAGEWIWRPLENPRHLRFNAFADENPKGFGLLQRDRDFNNYQDDGVWYELRPSLWVEPKESWGPGSVQLIEIPTVDETFDNIVAFWSPDNKPQPGEEYLLSYRLHWGRHMPVNPPYAETVATRTGLGGVIGQKREYYSRRFMVDFKGGDLSLLGADTEVEPVITVSGDARVEITAARPLHPINGYRASFDVVPVPGSTDQIDIRMYLQSNGVPLTETWLYQWNPPPEEEQQELYNP